uniref:Uncharacterized protein n=1 Tax=Arundo donax TaxID=35708 RepID=A0A0A9FQN1_ARUDO
MRNLFGNRQFLVGMFGGNSTILVHVWW